MSYRLHPTESVEEGLHRLTADQIARALSELDDRELGMHETVHQVRKRCKKLRGLLRLVRPALTGDSYARENAALRDAQRRLSRLRDAEQRLESFDALLEVHADELEPGAFRALREALVARRDRAAGEAASQGAERLERFRDSLEKVRGRAADWRLDEDGFDALRGGLRKTYRRARRALREAYRKPSTDAFHQWRKRVKYHLYHVRLLREVWKPALKQRRRALEELADLLGEEHDLAVLSRYLRAQPVAESAEAETRALQGLIAARRSRLRAEALPLGRRLFAENPKVFAKRLGAWHEVAREAARESPPAAARDAAVASPPG